MEDVAIQRPWPELPRERQPDQRIGRAGAWLELRLKPPAGAIPDVGLTARKLDLGKEGRFRGGYRFLEEPLLPEKQ